MVLTFNAPKVSDAVKTTASNEGGDARTARMLAFGKSQPIVYRIGRILSTQIGPNTVAELLVAGESFDMSELVINGQSLPLREGFVMSLATLATWGCPACKSAHGSGSYPSTKLDSKLLATNEFYYDPSKGEVFTVSGTCWGDYVKANGFASKYVQADVIPRLYQAPIAKDWESVGTDTPQDDDSETPEEIALREVLDAEENAETERTLAIEDAMYEEPKRKRKASK